MTGGSKEISDTSHNLAKWKVRNSDGKMVSLLFVTMCRIFKGNVENHHMADAAATHP